MLDTGGRTITKIPKEGSIIGLPPGNFVSSHVIEESMPIATIIPSKPVATVGMTVFKLKSAWTEYDNLLRPLGFERSHSGAIKVAFLADNFPTDSFTNEYGESFLQKITDVTSQGIREVMQITGTESLSQAMKKIKGGAETVAKATESKTISAIFEGAARAGEVAQRAMTTLEATRGGGTLSALLTGARVDFPQLWKNSGFTPSYTMTIRLYNPNPGSARSTEEYIIGPLAVLLCLAVPRSSEGNTYKWPFFQKVSAPGIYNLDPSMITNISVIKGGDQQQIAFNQRLGIVDVRIDFGSLFNTMLTEEGIGKERNRPTLYSYLDALRQTKGEIKNHYSTAEKIVGYTRPESVEVSRIASEEPQLINRQKSKRRAPRSRAPSLIPNRVSSEDKSTYEDLQEKALYY